MADPGDQVGGDGESGERSELACPVCGAHTLAVDEPPQIDIMGIQPYSDMLGMGDLAQHGSLGIVCRSCGTYWPDRGAFDRGEAEPLEGPPDQADADPKEG
ncbi:hypothetical protein BH24CHL9_BH24CHL9_08680 [soil metagenome]